MKALSWLEWSLLNKREPALRPEEKDEKGLSTCSMLMWLGFSYDREQGGEILVSAGLVVVNAAAGLPAQEPGVNVLHQERGGLEPAHERDVM